MSLAVVVGATLMLLLWLSAVDIFGNDLCLSASYLFIILVLTLSGYESFEPTEYL